MRPGEKLHEQMIGIEDAPFTFEYDEHFKILPSINDWATSQERIKDGRKVDADFVYSSETNDEWMGQDELRAWVERNKEKLGAF